VLISLLQACKPDPVFVSFVQAQDAKRLSFICPQHYCWDQSAYPSTSDEPPLSDNYRNVDLCGISACKVYPPAMLPLPAVSFYLTFSTSPRPSPKEREKAVIFCGTICFAVICVSTNHPNPALHRCIALCCPDFPPHFTMKR